jgi:DNA invertase Pin-like site-specific DNA recombinase
MTNIAIPSLPVESLPSATLDSAVTSLPATSLPATSLPVKQPLVYVSSKLNREHLQRSAILYVRQSTSSQLRDHQESTARQYQLTERLLAFGWPQERIIVIDEDLGISGSGKATRTGFRRLLKLVTEQQVGIVLGLEMSRLARNSKDWSDLFEVSAIFRTLIADEDGLFDPNEPNDRLVLGLKGIISEMELHTMKIRLERGRLNKAQRGELFHDVPVGYVKGGDGLPLLDPDISAQHAMKMFFDLFESIGSSHGLFHYLATHNIKLPFRTRGGPIEWRLPAKTTVYGLLKHPLYAGAYGYGLRKNYSSKTAEKRGKKHLPPEQWKVLIKDRFPAYITWQQYESNQQRLRDNDVRPDRTGPARNGSALLAGIIFCGECGRRMSPVYGPSGRASYNCGRHRTMTGVSPCLNSMSALVLDVFIADKLLEALSPAGVNLSLQVIEDEVTRRTQLDTLYSHRVQQSQYAVDLAQRRYKEVDPANRLVAASLERDWEAAMLSLQAATHELDELRSAQPVQLSDAQREDLRHACGSVSSLWHSRATIEERKQITRLLLQKVEVHVLNNSERVSVRLHWSGGFESCHDLARPVSQFCQLESYEDLIERTLSLSLQGHSNPEIAVILAKEKYVSPRSLEPVSRFMVQKLLEAPHCVKQLHDPELSANHWRAADLAIEVGIPEKRLKDWVTRGWATAVQRPHGRTWVIYANADELHRLQQLAARQTGQGSQLPPEKLQTPASIPRQKQ